MGGAKGSVGGGLVGRGGAGLVGALGEKRSFGREWRLGVGWEEGEGEEGCDEVVDAESGWEFSEVGFVGGKASLSVVICSRVKYSGHALLKVSATDSSLKMTRPRLSAKLCLSYCYCGNCQRLASRQWLIHCEP